VLGGIALGAAYLLWLFQRTMLGDISAKNEKLLDLSWREIAVFAPLIACAFWIGLRPSVFLDVIDRPVAQIVERVRLDTMRSTGCLIRLRWGRPRRRYAECSHLSGKYITRLAHSAGSGSTDN